MTQDHKDREITKLRKRVKALEDERDELKAKGSATDAELRKEYALLLERSSRAVTIGDMHRKKELEALLNIDPRAKIEANDDSQGGENQ